MESSESTPPKDQGHPCDGPGKSPHSQLFGDGADAASRLLFETPQRPAGARTAHFAGAFRGQRRQPSPSGSDASSVTSYALRKSGDHGQDLYLRQISKWQRDAERHHQLIDTELSRVKLASRKVEGRLSGVEGQCSAVSDLLHSQVGQSNSRISDLQAQIEDTLRASRAGLECKLKDVASASRASTAELEETVRRQGHLSQDLEAEVAHVLRGHASQHDEIRLSLEDLHARLRQLELHGHDDNRMSASQAPQVSSQLLSERDVRDVRNDVELELHPAMVALHERLAVADERFEQLTVSSHGLHERMEGHMVDLRHLRTHVEARDANTREQETRTPLFPDLGHQVEHLREQLEESNRERLEQHHHHGRRHDLQEQVSADLRRSMLLGSGAPDAEAGAWAAGFVQLNERVARLEEQVGRLLKDVTRTADLRNQGGQAR